MPRALNTFRPALEQRVGAFNDGLRACGFDVVSAISDPRPGDALLTWNRYESSNELARLFEARGGIVLVAENGLLGKAWRGDCWMSLARGNVAAAGGAFTPGGPERWDSWSVDLAPWHGEAGETVVFAQRGFGCNETRSPNLWAEHAQRRYGGRIRQHPGKGEEQALPLADDLSSAKQALTWHSGAGLKALALGVPVWHDFPQWIGASAARPLHEWPGEPKRDEAARLAMFRRAAWAMWTLDEIRTGEPIARTLPA